MIPRRLKKDGTILVMTMDGRLPVLCTHKVVELMTDGGFVML